MTATEGAALLLGLALLWWRGRVPESTKLWKELVACALLAVSVLFNGVEALVGVSYFAVAFFLAGALVANKRRRGLVAGGLVVLVLLVEPAQQGPWRWIAAITLLALALPLVRKWAARADDEANLDVEANGGTVGCGNSTRNGAQTSTEGAGPVTTATTTRGGSSDSGTSSSTGGTATTGSATSGAAGSGGSAGEDASGGATASGGSASGGASGGAAPEEAQTCRDDSDCLLVDDCCSCRTVSSESHVDDCAIDCDTHRCPDTGHAVPSVVCRAGRCRLDVNRDPSEDATASPAVTSAPKPMPASTCKRSFSAFIA